MYIWMQTIVLSHLANFLLFFDSNDLDFYINDYHLVIATLHNLPKTRVLEKHELEFK